MDSRQIIFETLYTLETTERKSHLLIRDVLDKFDYLDARDKAFIKRVTEGTIQRRLTLDYMANRHMDKPIEKCKPAVRVILRMSIYQLIYMDKIPDSAVTNEAVKLCKKYARPEFSGFVNAVLRKIAADKATPETLTECLPEATRLSIIHSIPEWIVKMFIKEQPDSEEMIKALCDIRPTCVSIINEEHQEEILKDWKDNGVSIQPGSFSDNTYLISNFEGMWTLRGFEEGYVIVRDESSMLAAMASGVDQYDNPFVIDTCAAPGGKTTTIAGLLGNRGHILSCDISEDKVNKIRENVTRMGITNVEPVVMDATVYNEDLCGKADIVICDVPCSGLGVIGRKSDLRYNISNEIMRDLSVLQKQIVDNAVKYVKPGGILIYSTCTIHKAENEKMVKYITENHPFEPDSLKPVLPLLFERERSSEHMIQLRPDVDGTDGFFVARLRKKND